MDWKIVINQRSEDTFFDKVEYIELNPNDNIKPLLKIMHPKNPNKKFILIRNGSYWGTPSYKDVFTQTIYSLKEKLSKRGHTFVEFLSSDNITLGKDDSLKISLFSYVENTSQVIKFLKKKYKTKEINTINVSMSTLFIDLLPAIAKKEYKKIDNMFFISPVTISSFAESLKTIDGKNFHEFLLWEFLNYYYSDEEIKAINDTFLKEFEDFEYVIPRHKNAVYFNAENDMDFLIKNNNIKSGEIHILKNLNHTLEDVDDSNSKLKKENEFIVLKICEKLINERE